MQHKRPPVPVIILLLLALLVGGYFGLQALFDEETDGLQASGTIEAVDVNISPEMAGRVVEVLVDEGASVRTGDLLLSLDDTLLRAQRRAAESALETARATQATAQAALDSAQIQFDLAVMAAQAEEQALRITAWKMPVPGDFDQPGWYFNREELIRAAEAEISAAESALDKAREALKNIEEKAASADFLQIEADLAQARFAYQVAKDVLDRTSGVSGQELRDSAQVAFDDAEANLEDIQKDYEDALTTESAQDVLEVRADKATAQERLDTVRDRLRALQVGVYSPKLRASESMVRQAQAAVEQAGRAIRQAEAQLALIDAQIEKLAVYAPADSTVTTRNIQPGEMVQPGATVLTISDLTDLTITVYVPEDRYGEISLGQQAEVRVDSFPGETFSASVVFISATAEFTPRNVQTVEGRSSTVYAIKLKVNDPGGKLKPGMPADVNFSE